jgi:predicted RNA-binding Zn-ribbon protein involved in translation (DUF1610 family)
MTCLCGKQMIVIVYASTYIVYWCPNCGRRETVVMRLQA